MTEAENKLFREVLGNISKKAHAVLMSRQGRDKLETAPSDREKQIYAEQIIEPKQEDLALADIFELCCRGLMVLGDPEARIHSCGSKEPTHPSKLELSEETQEALKHLEDSYKELQGQFNNPRAWYHHLLESAQTVETDARWLVAMLKTFQTS